MALVNVIACSERMPGACMSKFARAVEQRIEDRLRRDARVEQLHRRARSASLGEPVRRAWSSSWRRLRARLAVEPAVADAFQQPPDSAGTGDPPAGPRSAGFSRAPERSSSA